MSGFIPVRCITPFPLRSPGFYPRANCDGLLGLKQVGAGTGELGLWQHRHQEGLRVRDSLHLRGLTVHLEGEAEPSSGQANASDSTAAGMLGVPAWTCPAVENGTPDSALHLSSSSLSSLHSRGDTHQLS